MSTEAIQRGDATPRLLADTEAQDLPPGCRLADVGLIAQDWQLVPLQRISAFITKGSTPTTYGFKWERFGVLFLRSECVSPYGLDLSQSTFISPPAHEFLCRSEVREGDLLLTITGNVGRVVLLRGIPVANINQHIARIRVSPRAAKASYVYHFLSQVAVRQLFEAITTGQAYPQISLRQVRELEVPLPSCREQCAIAQALSDADGLLEALQALISKKRAIKQAAMQELLTARTRLPGFGEKWKREQMGRIGSTYGGLVGKSKREFGSGSSRYVTFLNVLENVVINSDKFEPVNVSSDEYQDRVLKGDLLFNGTSETPDDLAMGAVLGEAHEDLYLNSFSFGFRIHSESRHHALFLAYYFRGKPGRALMRALAQGATRYNMSRSQFLALEVVLPCRDEQVAIATVLSDMDAEIAALEARRDKTRGIKRGMMQQLLTGRVRLVKPSTAANGT